MAAGKTTFLVKMNDVTCIQGEESAFPVPSAHLLSSLLSNQCLFSCRVTSATKNRPLLFVRRFWNFATLLFTRSFFRMFTPSTSHSRCFQYSDCFSHSLQLCTTWECIRRNSNASLCASRPSFPRTRGQTETQKASGTLLSLSFLPDSSASHSFDLYCLHR